VRLDEEALFVRISDGASVVWKNGAPRGGYLWHATVDGLHAVCSSAVIVGDEDPYPSTPDRSDDMMTCNSCAGLVKRVRRAS